MGEGSRRRESDFSSRVIKSWDHFANVVLKLSDAWVFRGQPEDAPLMTSLEDVLTAWKEPLSKAPEIEQQLIREFRRHYYEKQAQLIHADTLYCLALMQHHGAPTRLLDWTYSPFVAAKFAVESGVMPAVVWAINETWCHDEASRIVGRKVVQARIADATRNDSTFAPLYLPRTRRKKFVFPENPFHLNERLIIQKGVFMCPGDITSPFESNLKAMKNWSSAGNIIKFRFDMPVAEHRNFVIKLHQMNVNSAALFPGLDGFARSLRDRIPLMARFAEKNVGKKSFKARS